ncbi:MAG TPA: HD domain-containing phosphohydrolase [Desulfuromonadales bacterium]|nr:HD domain-containing phosphohydrolase [Desulfuromonadales bacterium]
MKQVVQVLAAAIKGLRLYSLDHPATRKQVQTLQDGLFGLLQHKQKIKMGLLEGTLFIEDHLFIQEFPAASELAGLLESRALSGIEFHAGLSATELQILLNTLYAGELKGRAFAEALESNQVEKIKAFTPQDDEEEEDGQPRKVYRKALKVVDQIFTDVRMGQIPSSTEALKVVKSMARLTLTEPHALFALSMLKDYDNYTFTHSVNVSVISLAVGRACGVSEQDLRILGLGGLLHDLGKLKVDVKIITKPGRLTEIEFEEIKQHPTFGAEIIQEMEGVTQEVMDIVLCHHSRYDRKGYPLLENDRNLSRLVDMTAIADSYDAMTTLRSYQRPLTPRGAINRLREVAGTFLNPDYVTSFIVSLGPFPVGSLVRLDTNEIGLVTKVDAKDPSLADIKLLFDPSGDLVRETTYRYIRPTGTCRIVAEVDPVTKGMDVADFLD